MDYVICGHYMVKKLSDTVKGRYLVDYVPGGTPTNIPEPGLPFSLVFRTEDIAGEAVLGSRDSAFIAPKALPRNLRYGDAGEIKVIKHGTS